MIRLQDTNFDIAQICESGQCFRMEQIGDGRYSVIAGGKYLEVSQKSGQVRLYCSQAAFDRQWRRYFDLDRDYGAVAARIDSGDDYLLQAASFGSGIRILRQDLWEMIITFIISQQNNIKRIRTCIRLLCERYGRPRKGRNGVMFYDFPTARVLSRITEEDLRACSLGYRAKYIRETADMVQKREVDLDQLSRMDYEEARENLLKLSGVGEKVADCICLFALHHMEAFPVDTHIRQVLDRWYPDGFPFDRYRADSGIMQQYLFYYDLKGGCLDKNREEKSAQKAAQK